MSSEVKELVKGAGHSPSRFLVTSVIGGCNEATSESGDEVLPGPRGIHCPSKSCFGLQWQASHDGGASVFICLRHAFRDCYGLNCVPQIHNFNS